MMSHPGTIAIHILPYITQSKDNQAKEIWSVKKHFSSFLKGFQFQLSKIVSSLKAHL